MTLSGTPSPSPLRTTNLRIHSTTIKTVSYTADSRYWHAVCGSLGIETARNAGNRLFQKNRPFQQPRLLSTVTSGTAPEFQRKVLLMNGLVKDPGGESPSQESTDPTGFWRFVFWLTYVLGTLCLLLSWLLSQVPTSRGADLTGDLLIRSSAAGLMLISILMARHLWKIKNPLTDGFPQTAMDFVLSLAWFELLIATSGVIGLAIFRH